MSTITVDERIPLKKWLVIIGVFFCYLFWSYIGLLVYDWVFCDILGYTWPLPFYPSFWV